MDKDSESEYTLITNLSEFSQPDQFLGEERADIRLPIRVIGFDEARGRFIEDTNTLVVSKTGSLIVLKHRVFPADTVRVINLENMEEADFRVVGPSIVTETEVSEWGIEAAETERNIWGARVNELLRARQNPAPVMLACRACHQQVGSPATLLEAEVLNRTGIIAMPCQQCRRTTYWTFADPDRRPKQFSVADAVAPPPRVVPIRERAERRATKRALIKLPVLVRRRGGTTEVSSTEDISKRGFASSLATELEIGEVVMVMVPFQENGTNIPQQAKVVWKDPYPSSGRRWHGFQFARREG